MSNFVKYCLPKSELSIVEEAYFGRTKNIKALEIECTNLLKMFHQKYNRQSMNDTFDLTSWHDAVEAVLVSSNGKKCTANMEKAIQKEFGFNEVNIVINREFGILGPNALSLGCVGCIRQLLPGMGHFVPIQQGEGKYYDKKHSYVCTIVIGTTLLDISNLSGPELTAMILHELGHMFECTPMTNLGVFLPILDVYNELFTKLEKLPIDYLKFISQLVFMQFSPEIVNTILRYVNKIIEMLDPDVRETIDAIYKMIESVSLILGASIPFQHTKDIISSTVVSVIQIQKNPVLGLANIMHGYSAEVFADSFATSYGYGPELSSALTKTEQTINIDYNLLLNKANILKPVYDLSLVTYEIASMILSLDEHPATQKRIINQLNKLEREAQSSKLPPKLKQSVLADIKRQRQIYQKYLDADFGKNKFVVLSIWRNINDATGGHFDWKGIVNSVLNLGYTEA